jgi:hypothetical protein
MSTLVATLLAMLMQCESATECESIAAELCSTGQATEWCLSDEQIAQGREIK